jgi:hypothetical protein
VLKTPQFQDNIDGDTVSLSLVGHDSGTGTLVYSVSQLPTGATLNTSTGLILPRQIS